MSGYELTEWLEPGTMRRVLQDGTVEIHEIGPGTSVPGPAVMVWLDELALAEASLRGQGPPKWWRDAMLQWKGTLP